MRSYCQSTEHKGVKGKTGRLGIGIMYPGGLLFCEHSNIPLEKNSDINKIQRTYFTTTDLLYFIGIIFSGFMGKQNVPQAIFCWILVYTKYCLFDIDFNQQSTNQTTKLS
jgi:hypothetical protein